MASAPNPTPAARSAAARVLVVMRHAAAESVADSDAERPLTQSGVRDAADAGGWLAAQGVAPDHALVSAALRTEQTWSAVASAAGWDVDADLDPALYAAGVDAALDRIRLVDDDVRTLVVVGHNPTMHSLVVGLDDGAGSGAAALTLGFPTCSTVVLTLDGPWTDLGPGRASVVGHHVGRG